MPLPLSMASATAAEAAATAARANIFGLRLARAARGGGGEK